MNKLKTKKGDIFQIFFIIIIIFIIAVIGLIFAFLSTKITTTVGQIPQIQNTPLAAQKNAEVGGFAIPTADYFVFFMFLFGNIALMVAAARTNFSPTLIFIFIFLMLFAIFIAAGFVNIYQGLANNPTLQDTTNSLSLTGIIFSRYFPLFVTVISGIVLTIMYMKSGGDIVA